MKKKISKILGVGLALVLVLSFSLVPAVPVGANPGTITVDSTPAGTAVDPITGIMTLVVEWDDGDNTPTHLDIDIFIQDMYGHSPNVLGQDKLPHPYSDNTSELDIDFWANTVDPTLEDPLVPTSGWNPLARELAREIGFIDATYDEDDMEWTIRFNTQKKVGVGDWILQGFGWWPGQEVWFDGVYNFDFLVEFEDPDGNPVGSDILDGVDFIFDNPVHIQPELGLDAKGSQQKFWLNWIDMVRVWDINNARWESKPIGHKPWDDGGDFTQGGWVWVLDPGVNLTTWGDPISPYDIKVLAGGRPYRDSGGAWHPAEGSPLLPDRFIEVVARAPLLGDAEFEVWTVVLDATNPAGVPGPDYGIPIEFNEEVASAEKKWGELAYSKLDVHLEIEMDGPPTWSEVKAAVEADLGESAEDWVAGDHETWVNSGDPDEETHVHELVVEKVWASFLQLEDPLPAGGALVHWWLAKDTEANQAWIQVMMDDIVDRAGDFGFRGHDPDEVDSNEYWSATGDYEPSPADHPVDIIMDWIDPPGTLDDKFATETDLDYFIPDNWEAGYPLYGPLDPYLWKDIPMGDTPYVNPDEWYGRSVTMDGHLGEIPGVTIAKLQNYDEEDVLIITLVEYQQDYNGENLILIQIGKKHFRLPPPPVQVKIPQVRWAGEKIVLEKDWGDFTGYTVTFTVDQDSIGSLVPIVGTGDGNHVSTTVMADGVARVIFESEYEGQAEVKAVLYDTGTPIDNHDFPLFYLKLESIEPLDPTPAPLLPDEDTLFGVQVKGWFITKSSEFSSRPEKWLDIDPLNDSLPNVVNGGNGIPDDDRDILLPAGRWVLPDDWPTLAGIYELRRQWDLMNNWEDQVIFSGISPLGPYDGNVVTTTPPELAESPVIGPFNTTQPVAIEDEVIKWVTTESVLADYTVAPLVTAWTPADLRNTVVPDGKIDWFDAPMSPAKVIFQIAQHQLTVDLSPVMKSAIPPYYDAAADTWFAPYYSEEIPSSPQIPMGGIPEGYNWDSWGLWSASLADDGPYPFWGDLGLTTLPATDDEVIEVYTDNNGIAYVTINGLPVAGEVDIHAKVDYPYQRKHPALSSEEVTQVWGPLELSTHFESLTARTGDAPLTITFINLTTKGILPYVSAIWNWDDGTAPGTTDWDFGDTITHTYTVDGSYSPSLTITDSSLPPLVDVDTKEADYILVGPGVEPFDPMVYDVDSSGVIEKDEALAAVADYFDLVRTKAQALEVIALYFG